MQANTVDEQMNAAEQIMGQLKEQISALEENPDLLNDGPEFVFRRELLDELVKEHGFIYDRALRIATQIQVDMSTDIDLGVARYLASEFGDIISRVVALDPNDPFIEETVCNNLSVEFKT